MKQKRKILIVEDETSLINILEDKFSSEGFEVLKANNGQIGLDKALSDFPDLILLDIAMPVMDGLEMLKLLREDKRGNAMPVIILTNYGDMEKFNQAKDLGATDYLVKADWGMKNIVEKVKEILAK